MFGKVKPEHLPAYLEKIRKLFPEFHDGHPTDIAAVRRYYAESFWGYSIFHSWSGAIHMALSPSGRFSSNDYFRQAEEIGAAINNQAHGSKMRVLEVGCGRGFNLQYLAQAFPQVAFVGVDVSERNLQTAKKQLQGLSNVSLSTDDFHELASIGTDSIDIIFAVESLCHANDLCKVFKAMSRVIVPGGQLIVFDGFRGNSTVYSKDLISSLRYAEQAMAVPSFKNVEDFASEAKMNGFCLENSMDRSSEAMPNLIRLSDFAKGFFKIGPLSKVIMALVPHGLVANAIAGLLMAVTVQCGAHRYMKLSLRKFI